MDLMIEHLMEKLVQGGGSDLHLATGQPPYGRFSGELRPMTDRPLAEEDCNKLIFSMLNNSQRKTLEQTWELDCAYGLKDVARFRVNVYRQKGSYAACLRALGTRRTRSMHCHHCDREYRACGGRWRLLAAFPSTVRAVTRC